jgi:pyridoxine 5-phosphate synthase
MARLSVNVNKVATLRNARGGAVPSVLEAVEACIAAGAPGITVHPRADRRHITPDDVRAIARVLRGQPEKIELNVEGDPRPELLDLVEEVQADQCTLVPVVPGEVTSQAGWQVGPATDALPGIIARLRTRQVRVSLFVDASPDPIRWAAASGADRVELYTEPFARSSPSRSRRGSRTRLVWASTPATIWISPTSRYFANCRTSTRCRLGTPSSLARCLSVWRRWCASISTCFAVRYDQRSAFRYQPSAVRAPLAELRADSREPIAFLHEI